MEYVLPATLLLGTLLFLIGWLLVVVFGFKHHPITGLVAMVPVLNLLILPSIWHKVGGWVITGLVGLVLAGGAWALGGMDGLARYTHTFGGQVGLPAELISPTPAPTPVAAPTTPVATPAPAATAPSTTATTQPLAVPPAQTAGAAAPVATPIPVPLPPTEDLPKQALYQLVFENLSLDKLASAEGKHVRLIQTDGRTREGKLVNVNDKSVVLEERINDKVSSQTLTLSNIRQAAQLVKQGDE